MRLIRIALASVDPTVGAVRANADRVVRAAREMAERGATVGAFPEQVLGGYPPEDLVQWRAFVDAQREQLERTAAATRDVPTVLVVGLVAPVRGQLFNCAAVLHAGRILGLVPKEHLPTYDVFYEARTLTAGSAGLTLDSGGLPLGDRIFEFDFGTLAVEVCEDAWTPTGPMRRRCFSGAEIVVNISASPYRVGVEGTRREMLATRSADNVATLAYANLVGAQDGLVFDGGGYVFQGGRPLGRGSRFREEVWCCVVDLDRGSRLRRENTTWRRELESFRRQREPVACVRSDGPTAARSGLAYPAPPSGSFFLPSGERPERSPRESVLDDLFDALSLGVADYYRKSSAFRELGVAVSGGRDSLLTLLVAWRARQRLQDPDETPRLVDPYGSPGELPGGDGGSHDRRDRPPPLTAFYMPTRFSGEATREAALTICRELEVPLREVPLDDAFQREAERAREMLAGDEPSPVTLENIQARLRALRMWSWANSAGGLFLQTGDMSEKAVGYTTVGGDLEGGLSVIANLPKTVVVALLERLEARYGFEGIGLTLGTTPGPELAEDQAAEDELMPFPVLDACLHLYAGEKLSPEELARALEDLFPDQEPERLRRHAARFARLFTASIYKWVQAPLSLHVGALDLERERALQLPVLQRNEWEVLPAEGDTEND